jgi:hypothetical protein
VNMQKITGSTFTTFAPHVVNVERGNGCESVVPAPPHSPQTPHMWEMWKRQNTAPHPHTHTTPFRGCGMWDGDVGKVGGQ